MFLCTSVCRRNSYTIHKSTKPHLAVVQDGESSCRLSAVVPGLERCSSSYQRVNIKYDSQLSRIPTRSARSYDRADDVYAWLGPSD